MHYVIKETCLVLADQALYERVGPLLAGRYELNRQIQIHRAERVIRSRPVACVVAHVDGKPHTSPRRLCSIINKFPVVPVVGVSNGYALETARLCGMLGVDHVVSNDDLHQLGDVVRLAVRQKRIHHSLSDYGIDPEACTPLVQKALKYLEDHYIQLQGVQELADALGLSPETLSREFSKACRLGPKRLLMILKARHAVHLMRNPGLKLKEIGLLVGVEDQRRLNEMFHRLFGISPSELRKRDLDEADPGMAV